MTEFAGCGKRYGTMRSRIRETDVFALVFF